MHFYRDRELQGPVSPNNFNVTMTKSTELSKQTDLNVNQEILNILVNIVKLIKKFKPPMDTNTRNV